MSGGDPVLRFRRFAKARLRRFNGVARHVFGLHLQECVFRFNHQGEALEELLLGRLLAEPLRVGADGPEAAAAPSRSVMLRHAAFRRAQRFAQRKTLRFAARLPVSKALTAAPR